MKTFTQMINEAPNTYKKVIGGIYKFKPDITDEEIINHVLDDFSLKCANLLKDFVSPDDINTLCTYDLFVNRYGIDNPGDVSVNEEKPIYQEIPSEECAKLINKHLDKKLPENKIRSMFGGGEFPVVSIWKGHHQALDEIHVTMTISR